MPDYAIQQPDTSWRYVAGISAPDAPVGALRVTNPIPAAVIAPKYRVYTPADGMVTVSEMDAAAKANVNDAEAAAALAAQRALSVEERRQRDGRLTAIRLMKHRGELPADYAEPAGAVEIMIRRPITQAERDAVTVALAGQQPLRALLDIVYDWRFGRADNPLRA